MALLRIRMTPRSHDYSLYEIVYGRPPPIIKQVSTNLPHVKSLQMVTAAMKLKDAYSLEGKL